jgi:UDP-N-acetylmuramoyl-tripeptide--D-alanyl-D-alanine ligase
MATRIPANDALFSLDELAHATFGELRAGSSRAVRGVCTDTRDSVAGKLFVALTGDRFDGHDYVAGAVAQGAAAVLVSRDVPVDPHVTVIRVNSTLDALGRLAAFHRHRWGGTLVAVGGSAGKTTTRCCVAAALEAHAPGAVHSAVGNLNNRIGVPMVVLGIRPEHRYAVVELGTNLRGEMAQLGAVCRADVAVLTTIGVEHAEGIGAIEDIEAEEGELLQALGAAGIAVANGDDERCLRQLERAPAVGRITYGTGTHCSYRVISRQPMGVDTTRVGIELPEGRGSLLLDVPLIGLPGALAATAAVAVADRIARGSLAAADLAFAFATARFEPGRLVARELASGVVVIDDTYNSNPVSVRSSVRVAQELAAARGARLVIVLGEMRELGALSGAEHTQIGSELGEIAPSAVIGVGGEARLLVLAAERKGVLGRFAENCDAAASVLDSLVARGDVVLVKGSRSLGLERLVAGLSAAAELHG